MGVGYADMIANFEFYLDEKNWSWRFRNCHQRRSSMNYADDLEGQVKNSPYLGQILQDSGMDLTGPETATLKSATNWRQAESSFSTWKNCGNVIKKALRLLTI